MLLNQRRITYLQLQILVQTRTIQVLLSLQTAVVITLARLNYRITVGQTQVIQNQPNIHITGLHSTRR